MDEKLTITRAQLRAALQQWETDHRAGKTLSAAETAAMPVEEVAAASAEQLWARLQQTA